MEHNYYGEIVVNNKTKATDTFFTYSIPIRYIDKVKIGSKVIIPFGKGNKLLEGYIFNIVNNTNIKGLKSIKYVLEDSVCLTNKQIELCKWIRDRYLCTYYDAIQCIVPAGTTLKKESVYTLNSKLVSDETIDSIAKRKREVLTYIDDNQEVTIKELDNAFDSDLLKEFKQLVKDNFIVEEERFYNDVSVKYKKAVRMLIHSEDDLNRIITGLSRAPKQIEILNYLFEVKEIDLNSLHKTKKVSQSVINSLEEKGYININEVEDYRSPIYSRTLSPKELIELNEEQKKAYENIMNSIKENSYKKYLIHGITGSGKTEVYIGLVENMLKYNKQSIILVPEISLTPQLVNKFFNRFGHNIAVLHSKLSLGERYDQWKKIKNNEISIVIGARSAVFAPCIDLGLIIIDEEHESSYKSDMNPKYHTNEIAEYRCKQNNATLVSGSATPAVESYYNTKNTNFELLKLEKRFNNNPLPTVEIVDMRKELEEGNKTIFSKKLFDSMKDSLEENKQIILFLNRRGYSTFISCRSCGYVLKCQNCDISLTYHQNKDIAKCHYCSYNTKIPTICPDCGSKYIKYFGTGTQKVEEFVRKLFPQNSVQRLDVDTTSKKGQLEKIISLFEKRKIDILIGTQMVAKGLDFPYVTLVGVLSADLTLNLPDYRANEKTFQLLTQVAGRAGRHDYSGKVIVQTYTPDNYAITASQNHDYETFYQKEIDIRREFFYPPFCKIANILITGKSENMVVKSANNLFYQLKDSIHSLNSNRIELLGPNPAIYNRIKGSYRWQILIKYEGVDHTNLKGIINNICDTNKNRMIDRNVSLSIDLNTYNIF